MKSLKTLSLGLVAAAGFTGAASAQTVVHFVGSTAFRAPDTAAMVDYLASTTTGHKVYAVYSDTTKNLLNSGATLLANGTLGTTGTGSATVVIETFWTGSAGDLVDLVAQNSTDSFIDPNNAAVQTAVNASTVNTSPYGGGTGINSPATVLASADATFSDSFNQTVSKELATGKLNAPVGSFSTISALASAISGSTVVNAGTTDPDTGAATAGFVGIVPFQWVVGKITTAGYTAPTNINQQAARSLITSGFVPQSYLTGTANAADTANYFYLVGRNEDSGTRIAALSESQSGVTGNPRQFQLTGTASGVTGAALYPANTPLFTQPNVVWTAAGHSGYNAGGDVATALDMANAGGSLSFTNGKSTENSGSSYFIGYLGVTDAATAIAGGGKALTYGGIPFSVAAVQNGQYPFWTYEHCYHLSSLTGTAKTVADAVADNVYNTDADVAGNGTHGTGTATLTAGILDNPTSAVLVQRSLSEGGPLTNY